MQLHKLMYFAQAWHVAWNDEALFDDDIVAYNNGPVVKNLWAKRKHETKVLVPLSAPLSDKEMRTVHFVLSRYGAQTGAKLRDVTHRAGTAWTVSVEREGGPLGQVLYFEEMLRELEADPARDQSWFWASEWLSREREVDAEVSAGRVSEPMDADEFLSNL